ncbi:hypothetical protein LTR84_011898 [Exophiala bonariae]|uniref:Alpha-1,3-mannosyltransferase CMT1 n=1 Tax=Exophiala bonariae TaxID=1690606 RepID=A0AAV9NHQ1_9EURO|nr:hypothetical protein LTR84_011898 [Exophiala bonariae]
MVQNLYHEPLLASFVAIQDTLRNGTSTSSTVSNPASDTLRSLHSSSTPTPPVTHEDGQVFLPDSKENSMSTLGHKSQIQLSYQDCSTKQWNNSLVKSASAIVDNVMNDKENSVDALGCPAANFSRYAYLAQTTPHESRPKYFFALDLFQSIQILEQLLLSIVEAIKILGPENCVLSIVEGRSTDGTFETLQTLQKEIEKIGVQYRLQCVDIEPTSPDGDRILALALLRNSALLPLLAHPKDYAPETRIIFLNDVALCAEDILELIHQGAVLNADVTCAFDWWEEFFYDIWIGRTMVGDLFFEIPQSHSWDFARNLFWNHEPSRKSYKEGRPFQVFSCWNGALTITGKPFMEGKIKFRSSMEGECRLGEPVHLAKDLWNLGYGKIAVVPSVNVAYTLDNTVRVKEDHGTVSHWVEREEGNAHKIDWIKHPPPQIKCFVDWSHPSWEPWNAGLNQSTGSEIG